MDANSDLGDLYQELILDHHKRPRNFGTLSGPHHHGEGHNPLCGDRVAVDVAVDDGKISDVKFSGSGCAISTAAASMMTEAVKGKSVADADKLFEHYHQIVTGQAADDATLGKLSVFAAMSEFPMRVKCATLAWHTLQAALHSANAQVTTE